MVSLKRCWLILLVVLLMSACGDETPEETPTTENQSLPATLELETPSAAPTEEVTRTPTLRATSPASEPDQPQVRPVSNAIFIRSGPGEEFAQIGLLYEDETAAVLDEDDFGAWFEIRTADGEEGWVAASVVELSGGEIEANDPTSTPRPRETAAPGTTQLRVTLNSAYVRSGPGQNYPVIDSVSGGSTIAVLAYAQNGAWFNIRLSDGVTGWIGATVTEPVGDWSLEDVRAAATIPAPPPTPQNNCDPAYPTVCIPSSPPDLDCRQIPYASFTVLPPDPHLFDGDGDGFGCEPLPTPEF